MLEMIKKFRNSPKRTVITVSMEDCISINRQGDLRKAKKAYVEQKSGTKIEKRVSFADPMLENFDCDCNNENSAFEHSDSAAKATTECYCDESRYAFESCEDIKGESYGETDMCSENTGGRKASKTNAHATELTKKNSIYLTYPCCKMELKGGVRAKKTVRFLLCDAIAVMMGACAIKCAISKLMKLK